MKKFFKDDCLDFQKFSMEYVATSDISDELKVECLKRSYIVNSYKDDNYSVQIVTDTVISLDNTFYVVMLFDKDDNLIYNFKFNTYTKFVLNSEKRFGFDYVDFIGIQKYVNEYLKENNQPLMNYDFSISGKTVYKPKEPVEEVETLIKDGKTFTILAVLPSEYIINQIKEFFEVE